jgi:hypothetical protein
MTETATPLAEIPEDLSTLTKAQLLDVAVRAGVTVAKSGPKDAIVETLALHRERIRAAVDAAVRAGVTVAKSVDASLAEAVEDEPDEIEAEPVDETDEEIESTAIALREEPVVAAPALLPTTAEFDAMLAIADKIASTQMVPKAYRGRPDDVLAAILTGREMSLGPMQSLREIHIIDGKPTLSANLLLARMRTGGLVIEESESTAERAWVRARRRDTGETAEVEWTLAEAPADLRKKSNWTSYPADMLWARCVGRLARRIGGDLIGSVMPYSSEEVQDWDDDADPGEPRPFGDDRKTGRWVAPTGWSDLSSRIQRQLGPDTAAWMEEIAEKGYGVPTIAAVAQGGDVERGRDLWRRLSAVLRGLEDAERPIDGPLTFIVGVRQVIQRIVYEAFDGRVAPVGPPWALDPEEAKTMPQRDGTPPPEAVGGDLPAETGPATDPPPDPSQAARGAERAPETAPDDVVDADGEPIPF